MKKLLIALLALTLTLPPLAPAETFASGDYEYALLDDGTAQITKYTGSGTAPEIPAVTA